MPEPPATPVTDPDPVGVRPGVPAGDGLPAGPPDVPTGVRGDRRADLTALAVYAALSGWLFSGLLAGVRLRYLTDSTSDQRLFEYYLTWVAQALRHGHNPLVIPVQNAPDGVNAMGNTIVLALAAPLAPVTLWLGAPVSYALAMVLGVTASAWAWYLLFARLLPGAGARFSRLAAGVGGALVSFSPTLVSHANGHLNMVANFALPAIIGLTLRLREPDHRLRRAVALALCAVVQLLIGAEILLITALGFGTLLAVYGLLRPDAIRRSWRPVGAGLAIALAVALPLAAYPLWVQFAGPAHYSGLPFSRFGYADLLSFPSFATRSLAATGPAHYAKGNLTEENGYFGPPLLLLSAALAAWLWRTPLARAAALTGLLFAVLSLGNRVHVAGHLTALPGPWRLPARLPLLSDIIPSRLAYVTVVMVALLVALGLDRLLAQPAAAQPAQPSAEATRPPARGWLTGLPPRKWLTGPPARGWLTGVPARKWLAGLVVLALVPTFPTPLRAGARTTVPAFFSTGAWRSYLPDGATVVPVPLPRSPNPTWALDWQVAAGMRFRIAGGYFVGPWPADRYGPAGHGWYDQHPRPTDALLLGVHPSGPLPTVTTADQANAAADLRWWGASALVMDPRTAPRPAELKQLVDQLTGVTGRYVGGVWLWLVPG